MENKSKSYINKKENKNKDKVTSKSNSTENEPDDDEVVYLTDDDINDLIK